MNVITKINQDIDDLSGGNIELHPFYMFEPWDVLKRSEDQLMRADEDGIDLNDVEFVKHVGTDPHPFQAGFMLSKKPIRILLGGSQIGKALEKSTLVATEYGPIAIGELQVGDKVFGSDGKLHKVTGVYPQGKRQCYEFVFSDKTTCIADEDHLWNVLWYKRCSNKTWHGNNRVGLNLQYGNYETVTTNEIIDKVGTGEIKNTKRFRIPIHKPLEWKEKKYIIPPYSMGALLGDGSFAAKSITTTCHKDDIQIINRMKKELKNVCEFIPTGNFGYRLRQMYYGCKLNSELKRMSLIKRHSHDKFIPNEYKYCSSKQRLDLLKGLMDTDGSIYGKSIMEFTSKSKELAEDVVWIVSSLGGTAKIKEKESSYKKNGKHIQCGKVYRVLVGLRIINPFYLKRKRDRFYKIKYAQNRKIREINKIKGKLETVCITVDAEDKLFVLNNGIVTHNSITPRMEIWMMTTGEIPYALRYKAGVDTGVPRLITKENILRWGRRDIRTGTIIDRNWKARFDKLEWDCGNIEGVGIWPREKIAPEGSQIWIGTFREALVNYWWPSIAENVNKEYPDSFIDKRRGNKGTNKNEGIVFTQRDCRFVFLTYEMGHKRFEAKMAHTYIADEEMPSSDIWASAQEHSHSQSIVMTPLNGITWAKKLLLPEKKNQEAHVFHATQYDSPYQDDEEIDARRKTQEQWQRAARVWGQFAEQKGEPYYDRKKLNAWIHKYARPFKWTIFEPTSVYHSIRSMTEITSVPGLLETTVKMSIVDTENKVNTWRLYEDLKPGCGYVLTADLAEGAETPEAAGDMSAGIIARNPIGTETKPVIVATIRSTQEILAFARTCSYAMRYFNNALLASETGRGSANTAFQIELEEWPFWLYTSVIRNSTGKVREKKGFDINQTSRDMIFDLIGDWLSEFEDNEYPYIPDQPLLKELAASIVSVTKGGKKRCDHPRDGTLDSTVAFGILCYVFKNCSEQVRCNVETKPKERFSRFQPPAKKGLCGMTAMGYKGV